MELNQQEREHDIEEQVRKTDKVVEQDVEQVVEQVESHVNAIEEIIKTCELPALMVIAVVFGILHVRRLRRLIQQRMEAEGEIMEEEIK